MFRWCLHIPGHLDTAENLPDVCAGTCVHLFKFGNEDFQVLFDGVSCVLVILALFDR